MSPLLWSKEIHGSVGHSDAEAIITAPRLGDGNWRGGWWARYRHDTGDLVWRRYHRRGSCLVAIVQGVLVATTHKSSGIYAFSYQTGKKLWSRFGDHADWLLRFFEYLPCDNEADCPDRIQDDRILTRGGRLLDPNSGRILSRGVQPSAGNRSAPFHEPYLRYGGIHAHPESPVRIDSFLAREGLETSGPGCCFVEKHGCWFVIACPSASLQGGLPRSRLVVPAPPRNVCHYLVGIRRGDNAIIHHEQLGLYYHAQIAWADETTLALALQTVRQWNWSYRRDLRVYDLSGIHKAGGVSPATHSR